jgi:hypothetical protein
MSDEDDAKPAKSVMGNLPATRPTRMARRRDGEPVSRTEEAPAPARAKPGPKAAAKTKAKPAAKTKAGTGAAKAGGDGAKKPRAVRSGSPSLAAAKKESKGRRRAPAPEPPKGAEIVTTAVQATGELAKIGLTLGGQALKRAAKRLPKP